MHHFHSGEPFQGMVWPSSLLLLLPLPLLLKNTEPLHRESQLVRVIRWNVTEKEITHQGCFHSVCTVQYVVYARTLTHSAKLCQWQLRYDYLLTIACHQFNNNFTQFITKLKHTHAQFACAGWLAGTAMQTETAFNVI